MTRVADTAAGVTKTFAWDHQGRMTHAEVNNGGVTKSVDYANNPAGKRFMRVAGGVTKAWTYQGDNIASVESTTSPTLHSVYSGSGLGGVVERDDVDTAGGGSTTSRFYLYNHRGDVVGVSDASGNLTSAYDYDAYGAVSQSAQSGGGSAPTDDILFTGKDLDEDTGLYYFNARWYDSDCGRFVSGTELPPDGEAPYEFCVSNPIRHADSNGLWGRDVHWGETYDICRTQGGDRSLCGEIADADEGFDHGLTSPYRNPWLHFPQSLGPVGDKLLNAIASCDENAFGRALHQYQDYFAHVYTGRRGSSAPIRNHLFYGNMPDDTVANPKEYSLTINSTNKWLNLFLQKCDPLRRTPTTSTCPLR